MSKVASQELVNFIQSLPRCDGYIFIANENFYKEDDIQLLKFLNTMYKHDEEIITFELLETISVTENQKIFFNEIQDDINRNIERLERRMERR